MSAGEQLTLDHDEHNPYDPNAIKVYRDNGEQLGFLRAELAEEVATKAGRGWNYGVYITEITGGDASRPSCGVNLLIVAAHPDVSPEQSQKYVDGIDLGLRPSRPNQKAGCLGVVFMVLVLLVVVGYAVGSLAFGTACP